MANDKFPVGKPQLICHWSFRSLGRSASPRTPLSERKLPAALRAWRSGTRDSCAPREIREIRGASFWRQFFAAPVLCA